MQVKEVGKGRHLHANLFDLVLVYATYTTSREQSMPFFQEVSITGNQQLRIPQREGWERIRDLPDGHMRSEVEAVHTVVSKSFVSLLFSFSIAQKDLPQSPTRIHPHVEIGAGRLMATSIFMIDVA